MNHAQQMCDADQLEAYLQGRLDQPEEGEVELHLENCDACRRQIEQSAAEPSSWEEASILLGDPRWRIEDSHAATIAPPDGTLAGTRQMQSVIELLAPTDDPEMLGRVDGYEISGVIGCGGMGAVLKGVDRSLNRVVAIKVMDHIITRSLAYQLALRRPRRSSALSMVRPFSSRIILAMAQQW